ARRTLAIAEGPPQLREGPLLRRGRRRRMDAALRHAGRHGAAQGKARRRHGLRRTERDGAPQEGTHLQRGLEAEAPQALPLARRQDVSRQQAFRLSEDCRTCTFRMYGRKVELLLAEMKGNAGEVLRQAAKLAAGKKVNVTFRIDAKKLHVTVDPADLPKHPERRGPVHAVRGRSLGIDLNPNFIGMAVAQNRGDADSLDDTELLDHRLVRLDFPEDVPP